MLSSCHSRPSSPGKLGLVLLELLEGGSHVFVELGSLVQLDNVAVDQALCTFQIRGKEHGTHLASIPGSTSGS